MKNKKNNKSGFLGLPENQPDTKIQEEQIKARYERKGQTSIIITHYIDIPNEN